MHRYTYFYIYIHTYLLTYIHTSAISYLYYSFSWLYYQILPKNNIICLLSLDKFLKCHLFLIESKSKANTSNGIQSFFSIPARMQCFRFRFPELLQNAWSSTWPYKYFHIQQHLCINPFLLPGCCCRETKIAWKCLFVKISWLRLWYKLSFSTMVVSPHPACAGFWKKSHLPGEHLKH